MVVGESKRTANIMDGIENTGDVRLHDHRLRLKQRFDIVRKLGQGTYGKVQLGINKKTGQEVAIKTIKKCKIETEADLIRIRREVQIMSSVRHPNIVHIYEVFENSEKMILVMEYCSGGELYDYLSQKKVLEEDEARRLFRQIATAVYYCHIHKICHRDLKLENVLLDDTGSAKIADFGLSNVFKETSLLSTFCGSPLYASPEIVKGTPYIGPEVDCWSLGVLLYTLVYGAMPFDGSNFKRLVRQISNGDYYEPKNPSTASPLIRDMLTVDPLKRADIAYICDHPWVNTGCQTSCLEMAEALAAETPVRLDLLLSLAPAAPSSSNSVVVPPEADLGTEESCTDLTSSTSMAVEPSNSAEKRILELVAEGGEDAIKPSPTRTLVSADHKRKMDSLKDRVASCASMGPTPPVLPEEDTKLESPSADNIEDEAVQSTLKTSATITIAPAPVQTQEIHEPVKNIEPSLEEQKEKQKQKVIKKVSPQKVEEKHNKVEETKEEKPALVPQVDKITAVSTPQVAAMPSPTNVPAKPKKLSIGGHVGNFKEQFERRASLTTAPDIKRNVTKPVVSKIAKPKAQSEDRELSAKSPDTGSVRLQQIGIEPSQSSSNTTEPRETRGVLKTESEPAHCNTRVDPAALLQDARRSLQNSMAKLTEERLGEDSRRRAARDIISSAIRTGKPPVPYGRSSSAGVASLVSPPSTPPAPTATNAASPRVFRTEAMHRVEDHRPRGMSVERIIPITMSGEEQPPRGSVTPVSPPASLTSPTSGRVTQTPIRRLTSSDSTTASEAGGEPIKKSAREFIIPIAVEGKGYVTPRQRSLEPDTATHRRTRPRRMGSLVSGGESEEEDDAHMHRLRSTRAARAESVSSGEEDEEDEGFHLLTAENLFSTLLHRVRALTQRLNGEEGPGFQHPHSLFNNLQSPFFNSPHLPRRHLLREGWGSRDLHAPFESLFSSRPSRGSNKKTGKHRPQPTHNTEASTEALDLSDLDLTSIEFSEREMAALSGLTPALSRRLQRQLLAHLPPRAAARLRRTLSLHSPATDSTISGPTSSSPTTTCSAATSPTSGIIGSSTDRPPYTRCRSAGQAEDTSIDHNETIALERPSGIENETVLDDLKSESHSDLPVSQFCTLPRLRRRSSVMAEAKSPSDVINDSAQILERPSQESTSSKVGSVRCTPERPLLSKYLAPERNHSLDETCSLESGSILSDPSYIAAYGPSNVGNASGLGFRRHSLRLSGEQGKKRISRFLRSDFFDTPADENLYAKHKKEKELETQKILKEIREKKNKSLECAKSPTETNEFRFGVKDESSVKKCLSPVGNLLLKDRSRSNTPFFPILDNIKESALDSTSIQPLKVIPQETDELVCKDKIKESTLTNESKMMRPKSYPIKNLDSYDDANKNAVSLEISDKSQNIIEEKKVSKESKLMRPKSYPTGSPSPEKIYINRNTKKDETNDFKDIDNGKENKPDIEVSFNLTLPKKTKPIVKNSDTIKKVEDPNNENKKDIEPTLHLKRYQIVNELKPENKDAKVNQSNPIDTTTKVKKSLMLKDDTKTTATDNQTDDKKCVKKKVVKRVSSKSKTDLSISDSNEPKPTVEKKKVTKKIKDKSCDDSKTTVTKKRSVLQSIGHKLEKFASSKSNSPEKTCNNSNITGGLSKTSSASNRTQREQSVPAIVDPPTESNLLKRAVTITDVAALDNNQNNSIQNKTTVSKVLGLFKKFETKEKITEPISEYKVPENSGNGTNLIKNSNTSKSNVDSEEKAKRPTSLLLNGLGRKNRYSRSSSDDNSKEIVENEDQQVLKKKEADTKNIRNTLRLDFSRLPRVKKIVPTNPVIEPQIFNNSDIEKDTDIIEKNGIVNDHKSNVDLSDTQTRSRSRSRSTYSNSDIKSDLGVKEKKVVSDVPLPHCNVRSHESVTPEKEDIVDRIRRKSFYSRFNEKKQRRKSNLVGPGAVEYDPLARIHSQVSESKYDTSPTSPGTYDLSPGLSVGSDVSPSAERYRSLLTDLSLNTRNNSRYDGGNEKIDMYRSLDRNDFRKYPSSKSYLDYEQPLSYNPNRYSRTKSLFDSSDASEDYNTFVLPRETQKYNRTNSLFSPGSYATYRPKRTRNSAIILKESEKEPSPENILDKIRQRKISISVTRKPDVEKESTPRSNISPKGESDGSERSTKID
ncbi:uncharacterized protein LOC116765902 isoform X2 [Danaus plexippus]|uniref:uncharacterized protein LOC116765902 isoform X2 n=1 Tax=Danaus plexippus TaxID=13037 RepID=UPI002AB074F0|nr:uncharacterized protein LOC116765902 isoform X2 [Danaus plexippus]